ncbi:hypothetical protein MVEG_08359 [Podila verticillata NRRL 6337]|nr:hypothetical protein MVEG_08359 [Podila verticillata NRRL 6337]
MPFFTSRNFLISTFSLYIALDTYCSVVGYLDHRSDFLSWLFPNLLAIVILATFVFGRRSYSSDVNNSLATWTFVIGWIKPLFKAAMLLHSIKDGYSPEISLYPQQYGGWLEICVTRQQDEYSIRMCDVIVLREPVVGLSIVLGLVQVAALLKRDVVVMRWSLFGLIAVSGLVHAYVLLIMPVEHTES